MSQHPHDCTECTPRSQPYCGFCHDGPYSPVGPFAVKFHASKEPSASLSPSEELLQRFDQMRDWHRAEAKRRATNGPEGIRGELPPDSANYAAPDPAPRKRSRRTKQQMAEHRASVAARIAESRKKLLGDGPHWLDDDSDPLLEKILEAPRD